ncbi:hypothetical protein ACFFRR_002103 [Megaselia abdita]
MIFKVSILVCALFSVALANPTGFGAPSEYSLEKAEQLLTKTFLVISNGEAKTDIKVNKVYSATSKVVSGFAYEIVADLTINGENKEQCVAKILEPAVGKISETEISCPDGHHKQFSHTIAKRELTIKGAPKHATPEEAAKVINTYLKTLVGGPSFKLEKIHSATYQTVAGSLYKIKADFKTATGEIETCDVKVWEQPWLTTDEAVEFTFGCPEYGSKTFQHKFVSSE